MGELVVTVTVDWDAFDKLDHSIVKAGLEEIRTFAKAHPDVPLTHFICPAYFTRSEKLAIDYRKLFCEGLRQTRYEIGLHVHCYKSLVAAAKVQYRDSPSYHGSQEISYAAEVSNGDTDPGHGVALSGYSLEEISKIVISSKAILEAQDLFSGDQARLSSFRCGGWLANDNVLKAVHGAGFKYDASATDAGHFQVFGANFDVDGEQLCGWLAKMWCRSQNDPHLKNSLFIKAYPFGISIRQDEKTCSVRGIKQAQPRYISPPGSDGEWGLVEVPDTAVLADYTTYLQMVEHINAAVKWVSTASEDVFISLGFHLESAAWNNNVKHVIEAVDYAVKKGAQFCPVGGIGGRLGL